MRGTSVTEPAFGATPQNSTPPESSVTSGLAAEYLSAYTASDPQIDGTRARPAIRHRRCRPLPTS